jgi:hypothetical protein
MVTPLGASSFADQGPPDITWGGNTRDRKTSSGQTEQSREDTEPENWHAWHLVHGFLGLACTKSFSGSFVPARVLIDFARAEAYFTVTVSVWALKDG